MIIFKLILSISFAAPLTYKMHDGKKYTEVKIQHHGELRLTSSCFKGKTPFCDAFAATKKKVTPREPQTSEIGHPAVRYCHDKGGWARILISSKNNQHDYCRFKDGSMVDAWDLYYHHFPLK